MKYILLFPVLAMIAFGVIGCTSSDTNGGGSTAEDIGTLTLNITDAPVDGDTIAGVYISITRVEIGKITSGEVEWETLADYSDEPIEINLLDYTNGLAYEIGQYELDAGQYNQVRFILDIKDTSQEAPTSPGCYVEFTDETTEALFVPSGDQSGYKAVGSFEVPENGDVEVTVDFDVRKALHVTGQGQNQKYILKPTLRLVVDSNAGKITGTITNDSGLPQLVVYAYEDGDWDISEADEPAEGDSRFPDVVTSGQVDSDTGEFTLAYLDYDSEDGTTYDLVVVAYDEDGTFNEVLGTIDDVDLESNNEPVGTVSTNDLTPVIPAS